MATENHTKENFDLIFPLIMDAMKEMVVKEFLDNDSQLSGVVAFKVKTQLKEQGYTVGDKSGEKTPTFKQIADHFEKKSKKEKSDSVK